MSQGYGPEQPDEVAQPAVRHGSGWRFGTFAAVALLVLTSPLYFNRVVDKLQETDQDRRNAELRERAFAVKPPLRMTRCPYTQDQLREWGQFCWLQATSVPTAVTDLRRALGEAGAREVTVRCFPRLAGARACLVKAELIGRPIVANVFPARDDIVGFVSPFRPKGAPRLLQVSGGADGVSLYGSVLFRRTLPGDPGPQEPEWWNVK